MRAGLDKKIIRRGFGALLLTGVMLVAGASAAAADHAVTDGDGYGSCYDDDCYPTPTTVPESPPPTTTPPTPEPPTPEPPRSDPPTGHGQTYPMPPQPQAPPGDPPAPSASGGPVGAHAM